jgi:hypothetical protein
MVEDHDDDRDHPQPLDVASCWASGRAGHRAAWASGRLEALRKRNSIR